MTLRFSRGNGGGSESVAVRSGSSPSTRQHGLGRRERRGHEDRRRRLPEDRRQRPRRVEAHDGEAHAALAPLDDAGEVRPEHGEHRAEALQREVRVEDRIVHEREPRLALPREVAREARLPLRPQRLDLLDRRRRLRDRLALRQLLRRALEERAADPRACAPGPRRGRRAAARGGWRARAGLPRGAPARRSAARGRPGCAPRPRSGPPSRAPRRRGAAARRPARRRSCSRPRSRRRAARARAGLRKGRPLRGALLRRPCRDRGAE